MTDVHQQLAAIKREREQALANAKATILAEYAPAIDDLSKRASQATRAKNDADFRQWLLGALDELEEVNAEAHRILIKKGYSSAQRTTEFKDPPFMVPGLGPCAKIHLEYVNHKGPPRIIVHAWKRVPLFTKPGKKAKLLGVRPHSRVISPPRFSQRDKDGNFRSYRDWVQDLFGQTKEIVLNPSKRLPGSWKSDR